MPYISINEMRDSLHGALDGREPHDVDKNTLHAIQQAIDKVMQNQIDLYEKISEFYKNNPGYEALYEPTSAIIAIYTRKKLDGTAGDISPVYSEVVVSDIFSELSAAIRSLSQAKLVEYGAEEDLNISVNKLKKMLITAIPHPKAQNF